MAPLLKASGSHSLSEIGTASTDTITFRRPKLRSILAVSPWAVLWSWIEDFGMFWFLYFVLETVLWPPWVSVGPQGVRIRWAFSRRFYPWKVIERVDLGNPSSPNYAYLVFKHSLDPADWRLGDVLELPWLYHPTPEELVRNLADAKHRFQQKINVA
jgi:hypothetical protein